MSIPDGGVFKPERSEFGTAIRLFNRPTDQIWTSNLIGRFASGHQSNLSDCDLDNLDYLDGSM
jgi:hypothetical protein